MSAEAEQLVESDGMVFPNNLFCQCISMTVACYATKPEASLTMTIRFQLQSHRDRANENIAFSGRINRGPRCTESRRQSLDRTEINTHRTIASTWIPRHREWKGRREARGVRGLYQLGNPLNPPLRYFVTVANDIRSTLAVSIFNRVFRLLIIIMLHCSSVPRIRRRVVFSVSSNRSAKAVLFPVNMVG